jgi:hypothetical protein
MLSTEYKSGVKSKLDAEWKIKKFWCKLRVSGVEHGRDENGDSENANMTGKHKIKA